MRSITPQSAEMERYEGASHAYETYIEPFDVFRECRQTGDWLTVLGSNQAALRSASTLRSQPINGFQLALFWSTILRS
jgi:hypothetical protein